MNVPAAERELALWPVGTGWRVMVRPDPDTNTWLPRGPVHDTADQAHAYALELDRAGRGRLTRKVGTTYAHHR